MNEQHENLLRLIRAYVAAANRLLHSLKVALGVEGPLLRAYRSNSVGQVGQAGGIDYQIHGGGVMLADEATQLDLQLGAGDFAGAFDAWRLVQYAKAQGNQRYLAFENVSDVKVLLRELLAHGAVEEYGYLGKEFYNLPKSID